MIVISLDESTRVILSSFEDFYNIKIDTNTDDIVLFLENLYELTSINTSIIGAGTGKLTLKQEKVLFTKESIIQDGVLLLTNSWHVKTSAKHGWKSIAGPLIANNVDNTLLHSLDYKDAFEAYKEIVEKDSNLVFDENNFFDITKSYPLGISTPDDEILVRDPITRDKNSLILVGNIDNNSVVYILKGDKKKLIESAKIATKEAISKKETLKGVFIIDCISRVLFLEDNSKEVLQTINADDVIMFGVLSLGEIANTNYDYIDFYNKTCIIGAF